MNMPNLRNLPLMRLAFLVVAVAVLACPATWVWNTTHNVHVNVSREEYQAALARWRALGVEEYEITIRRDHVVIDGVPRTLLVAARGETIIVIDPPPWSSDDPQKFARNKADTVEGMFADVEAILDNQVDRNREYSDRVEPFMNYRVTFHPQMGYPVEFVSGGSSRWPLPHTLDRGWKWTVISLKILKQSGPSP